MRIRQDGGYFFFAADTAAHVLVQGRSHGFHIAADSCVANYAQSGSGTVAEIEMYVRICRHPRLSVWPEFEFRRILYSVFLLQRLHQQQVCGKRLPAVLLPDITQRRLAPLPAYPCKSSRKVQIIGMTVQIDHYFVKYNNKMLIFGIANQTLK